jgi:chaperone required for assembly of F1-ATPase
MAPPRLAPPVEKPRRFYKTVLAGPSEGGFCVRLDGKPVRTPGGKPLAVPSQTLARMLAAEWDAQETHIDMTAMGSVRLAFTAIEHVPAAREAIAAEVGRYAGSDVLCYFADGPTALVERQQERWTPALDWAERALGLRVVKAVGIVHQPQPTETLLRAARLAEAEGDFVLAGLAHATALFGSAILAFGLRRGEYDAEAAFDLSRLDEAFQEERWGVDEEAAERTAALRAEARMLGRWFEALDAG